MKHLKLLVLGLILVSPLTFAVGEKLFSWEPPTERVDGTALPEVEIDRYRIYCDGNPTFVWEQTHVPTGMQTWQAPANTFALGSHNCHATTIDTEGQESDPSNVVNFIVLPARPKAPILVVQ